jgi:hypothetical protein
MNLMPIRLGDMVEKCLLRVGVTPERVEKLFGIEPGKCGCESRKHAMNTWGSEFQYNVIMFLGGPGNVRMKYRINVVKKKLARKVKNVFKRSPFPN